MLVYMFLEILTNAELHNIWCESCIRPKWDTNTDTCERYLHQLHMLFIHPPTYSQEILSGNPNPQSQPYEQTHTRSETVQLRPTLLNLRCGVPATRVHPSDDTLSPSSSSQLHPYLTIAELRTEQSAEPMLNILSCLHADDLQNEPSNHGNLRSSKQPTPLRCHWWH